MLQVQHSIHPRNWTDASWANEESGGRKKNTCKPSKGKGNLAKKQKNLLRRRNAHSDTLKTVSSKAQLGYKSPGSMNEHK